ncbi:thiamine transport system substrate-binding protein [Saccharopolyspora erythraea NRRL 2338]|uniref:ABC transporter substrate-binding protein n=3 Tax=Saccharopolyspora erythraea TaxID=1836 RepID=A4F8D8_SACEN|nr:thiamine ABC transporter substrate-binding protein [Saccharopolyspora erythraea]PFG94108.1 thiamine transport system substrate-binding protein [Saccharopolyspora erythraea NRRL 2338]QRK90898.1 thiamine ABC transporter substrate-binding protein [Saccharopolyspora erythraea]CAM00313.1 ABC transporter substrate-binding protein [Saccharopolyspora erythraea NRRL 2338]
MNRFLRLAGAAALAALTASCSLAGTQNQDQSARTVTLVAHDSFVADEKLLAKFQETTGIRINVLNSGDAGELTNKLVLSKASPIGDVAYGVDSTFASRALREGVFEPHRAPNADQGPQRYALEPENRLSAVDVADVCVNIDTGWFAQRGLPEPANLRDLADPRYRDLFSVPDPTTSSPGLAFLLSTVAAFGENGWQDYWRQLAANGTKVSSGWEEAYNQDFSGSAGKGPRPIVLSYASSPAAEVNPDGSPRTKALTGTCYRQVEYAGVLRGAKDPEAAGRVVDFLLSPEFQAQVADTMYVYPSVRDVPLPQSWVVSAPLPPQPAELPAQQVEQNRDRWVEQWRAVVRG